MKTGKCPGCRRQWTLDNGKIPLHYTGHSRCVGSHQTPMPVEAKHPTAACPHCGELKRLRWRKLEAHAHGGDVCPGSGAKV